MRESFAVYSDESGCFTERYQAIGIVSGQKIVLSQLSSKLMKILIDKNITELKFSNVRTHSPKIKAAKEFIKLGIEFAGLKKIRVDVLVYDTQDSRHSVRGRDDVANLERMYYKVLRHISERWGQIDWEFYPDEQSAINWQEITTFLNRTKMPRHKPNILSLFEQEKLKINFKKVEQLKSHKEPLIQFADIFAGIASFSRENGEECLDWIKSQQDKNQLPLFPEETKKVEEPSQVKRNRFELIWELKKYRLRISLKSRGYLWTREPSNPINFWNYEPQHEKDKAPTR